MLLNNINIFYQKTDLIECDMKWVKIFENQKMIFSLNIDNKDKKKKKLDKREKIMKIGLNLKNHNQKYKELKIKLKESKIKPKLSLEE